MSDSFRTPPASQRSEDSGGRQGDVKAAKEEEMSPSEPMLSVLNLIFDHVMVPPSPLEPEEFQDSLAAMASSRRKAGGDGVGKSLAADLFGEDTDAIEDGDIEDDDGRDEEEILVPVVRIFGPVVRGPPQPSAFAGQWTKGRRLRPQSACLHVHGAFPYVLARPVVAGPDGSPWAKRRGDGDDGRIDWDDPESVGLILDEVHAALEGALRAYEAAAHGDGDGGKKGDGGGSGDSAKDGAAAAWRRPADRKPRRFVRGVSVSVGRGFYTFCPGPPAPFLRIEYYDPKARWKVKMMLERGLELAEHCHPDPKRYDLQNGSRGGEDAASIGQHQGDGGGADAMSAPLLKFRCYEAHIPYSMQFFKDHNLAGMKYVKVGDGRFRGPLPRKARKWNIRRKRSNGGNREEEEEDGKPKCCFLSSNVDKILVWEKPAEKQPVPSVGNELSVGKRTVEDNSAPNTKDEAKFAPEKAVSDANDRVVTSRRGENGGEAESDSALKSTSGIEDGKVALREPAQSQAGGESTAQSTTEEATDRMQRPKDGTLCSEPEQPAPVRQGGSASSQELCILEESGESTIPSSVRGVGGSSAGFILSQSSGRSNSSSGNLQGSQQSLVSADDVGASAMTDESENRASTVGPPVSDRGGSVPPASLALLSSLSDTGVAVEGSGSVGAALPSSAERDSSFGPGRSLSPGRGESQDTQRLELRPVRLEMSDSGTAYGSTRSAVATSDEDGEIPTANGTGNEEPPQMNLLSRLLELGYDPHWTRKQTSADLELDTTVEQLLNSRDVLAGPQQDTNNDEGEVHWRAVPSLREIWETERRRMKELLDKEHDFLSYPPERSKEDGGGEPMNDDSRDTESSRPKEGNAPKTPPFTLSVKKGASVPGARLAIKGMHKLFQPSPGLEEDYRCAMSDILRRHERVIDKIDSALLNGLQQGGGRTVATGELSAHKSNAEDKALHALHALGGQFGGGSVDDILSPSTPADFSQRLSQGLSQTPYTASTPRRRRARFAACTPVKFTQADRFDMEEFGNRIDRGEVPDADLDDMIDPATLTPFDDGQDKDDDFLDEEERMGEAGLERSLSILAARASADIMGDIDETKETGSVPVELGKVKVTEDTSVMAKKIFSDEDASEESLSSVDETGNIHMLEKAPSTRTKLLGPARPSELSRTGAQTKGISAGCLYAPYSIRIDSGCIFEPKGKAPRRSEFDEKGTMNLFPITRSHGIENATCVPQPWLRMNATYNSFRAVSENDVIHHPIDDVSNSIRATTFEPVRRPPSMQQVASWLSRKRKQESSSTASAKNGGTSLGKDSRCVGLPRSLGSHLEMDENNRKLRVATPPASAAKKRKKRVAFASDIASSSGGVFEIENVEWADGGGGEVLSPLLSQSSSQASQSQSQSEEIVQELKSTNEMRDGPKGEGAEGSSEGSPNSPATPCDHTSFRNPSSPKANKNNASPTHETPSTTLTNTQGNFLTEGNVSSEKPTPNDPLQGIGQQGGRLLVEGGGGLKVAEASTDDGTSSAGASKGILSAMPTPLTIMSIEVHVQSRMGRAGVHDSREIAMCPDPERDAVFAVCYIHGLDPGGGEAIEMLEKGCIFVPVGSELDLNNDDRRALRGISSNATVEMARSEKHLLLRLSSIIQWKDPDALLSWDTQGGGVGYLIERGAALGKENNGSIDMARLLGRTPRASPTLAGPSDMNGEEVMTANEQASVHGGEKNENVWSGSGLGTEWDERVGAGAAAASIVGRLVFCGWKLIAEEVKHPNASYQPAMVSTVLGRRIPYHDPVCLTRWYGGNGGRERWRVLQHRLSQCRSNLLLFDALDIVGRAGEAARLSGVEFSQSLPGIRGSQYKVEGVLLRALQSVWSDERGQKNGKNVLKSTPCNTQGLGNDSQSQSPWKLRRQTSTKEESGAANRGYFFFSPSRDDCTHQEALECQALTLEPQSGFHFDPVVVCDFTALYPSLVIAYNLCYSTIAGKLDYHSTRREMNQEGRTTSSLGPFVYAEDRTAAVLKHHLKSLARSKCNASSLEHRRDDRAYVVPTGSLFLSESVLKGVLPQVLDELLSTRAMLKKASKQYRRLVPNIDPAVLRSLEAKQLALKYVANVTYGYTSATFSGRSAMPLLADAIVECGRRTLTNAINLANGWGESKNGKWAGAHVIYGDTDSVFVKLPGRSVKEAFCFGEEFCKAVTASNPPPVQLKLEKVYVASLLQTKKKYCGMKYESPEQRKPAFEAKGIETVRRDQCKLTQKVLRNALVTIFQRGIDAAKQYVFRQWALIHAGRLPVSDYILTGRVRSRYRGGKIGPVQAALARRLAEADPGRVVRHKERLPYVIVAAPGLSFRLRDCVLTPTELLEQWDSYTIHASYYTTKHVNSALQRCLGLSPFNIDVQSWYECCPKPRKRIHHWPITRSGGSTMISAYFGSDICALCGSKCKAKGSSRAIVCIDCSQNKATASYLATMKLTAAQIQATAVAEICQRCNNCSESAGTFAVERATATTPEERAKKLGLLGNTSIRMANNVNTGGVETPLANCVCIDCPITYERHKLREAEIEATSLCRALDLF